QAVQETQGVKSVLVVGGDGKVAMRTVQAGGTVDNLAVIDSGVKPGERGIVEGAQKVRPGMQVAIQQGSPQPAAAGRAPQPPAR
ncbi:MAG: efflux transporter periplasmic adaptor subunit, partial [Myxococcales bacterium]